MRRDVARHPVIRLALRPHDPRRPLLVGEMNPLGGQDAFALFPVPRSRNGGRLATFLGLSDEGVPCPLGTARTQPRRMV